MKNKNTLFILICLLFILTVNSFILMASNTIRHEVQAGESLFLIAQRYGSNVQAIKSANKLSGDKIYVNQDLSIPVGSYDVSFSWPVRGRISSGYGYRVHPIRGTRHFHGGLDIAVPKGTEIKAAAGGIVVWSGWVQGFGQTIVIDHQNGYKTLYGHNSSLIAKSGSWVNSSQLIALAGSTGNSTGPHLDFRIYKNGDTVNPLNYLS